VRGAGFVLAVRASLPPETLRRSLPNQIKIGPVEQSIGTATCSSSAERPARSSANTAAKVAARSSCR
jgi:hypothetical protein